MNTSSNSDLETTLKKQEFLLQQIATTQTEILAVEKQRLRTEQYQIIGKVLHTLVWIFIIWFSFTQIQKITQGFSEKIMATNPTIGESANLLNGARTTTNILNDLLGY